MINPKLNIIKAFREQMHKCMNNKFVSSKQPFIRATSAKNNKRVLELLMCYETRNNPKKGFKVLSCVIYIMISNYVCIDYIECE